MIDAIENPQPALLREANEFLLAQPAATGASGEHDARWLTVLRDALGHRPYLLLARQGGEGSGNDAAAGAIIGYLPLTLVASRLFGRFLVSLPYLNRGGVIAPDPAVAAALIDRAVALAQELDALYLELRHSQPIEHAQLNGRRDEKFRMVLALPGGADGPGGSAADSGGPEALWKTLDAKVRNQIRKGDKSGLSIHWGGAELLDDFYDVFAVNMRDLGTPVYPKALFGRTIEEFAGEAELASVRCEGRAIAGALLVHCGGRGSMARYTMVPSASCLRGYNHTNANMWMYHHLLLRAIERGSGEFDFGRSSEGSGTYRFKKQWGALPQETVWQYHLRRGDMNAMRPDSPKNRWRIALWQKLPVWLTRKIGPSIIKGIP